MYMREMIHFNSAITALAPVVIFHTHEIKIRWEKK